ncbi:hypothetical protein Trydic_g22523 [Trypoxylus dichotomus]
MLKVALSSVRRLWMTEHHNKEFHASNANKRTLLLLQCYNSHCQRMKSAAVLNGNCRTSMGVVWLAANATSTIPGEIMPEIPGT